jgi:hypothetical protein
MLKLAEAPDRHALCDRLADLEQQRAALDTEIRSLKDTIADTIGRPTEGAKTTEVGPYKLTINQPIYRKVDEDALYAVQAPQFVLERVFRRKHDINLKEWRYFANNEPDLFAELAKAVTEKPGAVSVKLERRDS